VGLNGKDLAKAIDLLKGRNVLVTGNTGFMGSWLSAWLLSLEAKVTGYALDPPTDPSMFDVTGLGARMTWERGDINDLEHLKDAMQRSKAEVVFHLAAQPLVRRSYSEPILTFDTNVVGTAKVLESVRGTPSVKACICITSDKCYENREWVHGYRESDPMGGKDPYSASKGAAELIIASYRDSYFSLGSDGKRRVGVASARAGNVIGGGDWAEDRIVPDCVRALSAGRSIQVRNPAAVRPWQHVLEPLAGYLLLASRLLTDPDHHSSAWNFGPRAEDHVPVMQLVQLILNQWGEGKVEVLSMPNQPHEAGALRLDCTKAQTGLGWYPALPLKESVRMTVEWYKGYQKEPSKLWDTTLRQIDEYVQRAQRADSGG
jgi:CDP-glucose 4,6-dehydratase